MSSPTQPAEAGENTRLLVGIPFGLDADWAVVSGDGRVDGSAIRTADAPPNLPQATLYDSDPSAWVEGDNYLLSSINQNDGGWTGGTYWTFIMDRQGRMVWARPTPSRHWTLFAQVSVTGDHILWDESTLWSSFDGGAGSKVHRTYLDQEIEVVATPGLHHAFVELPDGTLTWGSQDHGGGEALVELAPGADDETVLWTCSDDWPGSGGGCESNGIYYSPERNTYLYSFYTNSSLVEVDRETGESLWWAGEVDGGYEFDPPEGEFTWQHGVSWTDAGTLLLSTESVRGPNTTLVREYEVDEDEGVLRQIWYHDSDIYAQTNGQAWRLDNGNTLHVIGSASAIKEITVDNEEVWSLKFPSDRLLGHGEFIDDLYDLVSP
jgi:hypothetical protein